MPLLWKRTGRFLNLALLIAAAGCGRGGTSDQAPTASIGDQETTVATKVAGQDPSSTSSNPLHPVVIVETSLGKIVLTLDAEKAKLTVPNFLSYVNAGHYDQTIIHQVYKGQGFLAGGYDTNLTERRGRTPIYNEADNGLKNRRGTIAMARAPDDRDSATCQFFINAVDNPTLDHRNRTLEGYGYCVFGEVTEGKDVVDKIAAVEVHDTPQFDCTPVHPVVVNSIRQVR